MKFRVAELPCYWAQALHVQNLCRIHMVTQLTGSLNATEHQLPTVLAVRVNGNARVSLFSGTVMLYAHSIVTTWII